MKKEYETTSLYLACFLAARGLELARIERSPHQRNRATFIFLETEQLRPLVDAFVMGTDPQVGANEFVNQMRQLKSALYDGIVYERVTDK